MEDFFDAHRDELRKALNSSRIPNILIESCNLQVQKVEEIGDGNLNFVYRIIVGVGGAEAASLVLKHAPVYIKVRRTVAFDNSVYVMQPLCLSPWSSAWVPSIH